MKKHLLFTLITAIAICLVMTVAAFADSTPIKLGDTVKATFLENGGAANVYEYSFTLKKSGSLKINVTSTVDNRIWYTLNGTDLISSVVARDNYSATAGYISKGDTDLKYELAAGEYVFKLEGEYTTAGDLAFTTDFESAKETYTNDNNSVNAIRKSDALTFNKKVYGHFAFNDSDDWYKVVLPASGKLTLDAHVDADGITYRLDDADGGFIAEKFIGKGDETIELELAKGTYYLHFNENGFGKYNFKPTFKDAKETYQFENETINLVRSRKAIPFATVIKGHFGINDTEDVFKIKAPKSGKYTIKVTSAMDNIYLNVRDKNDEWVAEYFHNNGSKYYTVKLKKGSNYLIFKADSNDYGKYSIKVTPAKVSIKTLKKATKAAKVTWSKGTGDGYQLQYSTSSSFKTYKTKNVSNITTTSKTIKSLKSKKTYYVRIRTYVKASNGDKIWSDWSKAKSVKTL